MSTRSVIAFSAGKDKWEGRYHHSDGYPEGLGEFLYQSFHGYFKRDLEAMRKYLFTDHPAGFSSILGADLSLPCGYAENYASSHYELGADGNADFTKPKPHGAHCFCHGARSEKADLRTSEDIGTSDLEWLYVLADLQYTVEMRISRPKDTGKKDEEGYNLRTWEEVARIDLSHPEPDWERITCGEKLERCSHYAHKHFPELNGTVMDRIGTATFLGNKRLSLDDVIGYEVGGITFGTDGDGMCGVDNQGANVWIATVIPEEGVTHTSVPRRFKGYLTCFGSGFKSYSSGAFDMIVARKNSKGKMIPYRGVKPIYPPTIQEPIRLFAELRKKHASANSAPSTQPTESLIHSSNLSTMLTEGRLFREDEKVNA